MGLRSFHIIGSTCTGTTGTCTFPGTFSLFLIFFRRGFCLLARTVPSSIDNGFFPRLVSPAWTCLLFISMCCIVACFLLFLNFTRLLLLCKHVQQKQGHPILAQQQHMQNSTTAPINIPEMIQTMLHWSGRSKPNVTSNVKQGKQDSWRTKSL